MLRLKLATSPHQRFVRLIIDTSKVLGLSEIIYNQKSSKTQLSFSTTFFPILKAKLDSYYQVKYRFSLLIKKIKTLAFVIVKVSIVKLAKIYLCWQL